MADQEPYQAQYEGWFSRLHCERCDEMFEVEDDVHNGEEVRCDACGADLTVRRTV